MFYMGEPRKLWQDKVPDDLYVYELALELHKTPDEVRAIPYDDLQWLKLVLRAKGEAAKETSRRNTQH